MSEVNPELILEDMHKYAIEHIRTLIEDVNVFRKHFADQLYIYYYEDGKYGKDATVHLAQAVEDRLWREQLLLLD